MRATILGLAVVAVLGLASCGGPDEAAASAAALTKSENSEQMPVRIFEDGSVVSASQGGTPRAPSGPPAPCISCPRGLAGVRSPLPITQAPVVIR